MDNKFNAAWPGYDRLVIFPPDWLLSDEYMIDYIIANDTLEHILFIDLRDIKRLKNAEEIEKYLHLFMMTFGSGLERGYHGCPEDQLIAELVEYFSKEE